jgi:hypothetical protein
MIFYGDIVPVVRVAHLLEEASARTGFAVADIEALVDCELDTSHVLQYIDAVVGKRMN